MHSQAFLSAHEHEFVSDGVSICCHECDRQHAQRELTLAMCGYSAGAINLLAGLVGKLVRYRWGDRPWGVGTVLDWEYPNCCLLIEECEWLVGVKGRDRWLRFGWSGMIDDQVEFVVMT